MTIALERLQREVEDQTEALTARMAAARAVRDADRRDYYAERTERIAAMDAKHERPAWVGSMVTIPLLGGPVHTFDGFSVAVEVEDYRAGLSPDRVDRMDALEARWREGQAIAAYVRSCAKCFATQAADEAARLARDEALAACPDAHHAIIAAERASRENDWDSRDHS